MTKEITYKTINVTPSMAETWLEKNNNNRKLSSSVIKNYAEKMKKGHWNLTHQSIAFDKDGNLVDGQHRLSAVIISGIPVVMTVAFYPSKLDPFSIALDDGKKRNFSDLTGIPKEDIEIMKMWINVFHPLIIKNMDYVDYKKIYSVAREAIKKVNEVAPCKKKTVSTAAVRSAVTFELLIENDWRESYEKLVSGIEGDKKIDNIRAWLAEEIENFYGMPFRRYCFGGLICMIESNEIVYPSQTDAEQKIIDSKPFFDDIIKF